MGRLHQNVSIDWSRGELPRDAGPMGSDRLRSGRPTPMDLRPLIPLVVLGLAAAALYGLDRLFRWMTRRGWIDLSPKKAGRGVGHAMLGLQEFIEPGIEHVLA